MTQVQHADLESGEMQESSSQEAPHFSDFSAPQSPTPQGSISTDAIPQPEPMKERIRWPKMSVIKEWASLDEDLNRILEVTSAGTAERKVNTLTEITYNLAKERFGTIERKINIKAGKQPNRREREIYSAECKIFFSVLAKRMSTYIIENGYVNTSIQKGGIPRFAGCLEHTGVLCQMIHEARAKKGDLTVVWLDLANAYGSIPHNLIRTALKYYHIPYHIMVMISSYLDGIKLRFKMKNYIRQWQHLERGICHRMYSLPNPVHHGHEPYHQSRRKGNQRSNDGLWKPATSYQGLYGRPYNYNILPCTG